MEVLLAFLHLELEVLHHFLKELVRKPENASQRQKGSQEGKSSGKELYTGFFLFFLVVVD